MCYTYDSLDRVTKRTLKNELDETLSEESFSYDAAGNITDTIGGCFEYDTNNRLISSGDTDVEYDLNGNILNGGNASYEYDLDGNMTYDGNVSYEYDSANRLLSASGHSYTYNAEDVRIRDLCEDEDTTYTYNTNCKLSQLLTKTTNDTVTKYVYGRGLIGEETDNVFKTYHFDFRGSTVAITDQSGNITDTFTYDTYGKLISRTGTSDIIFLYNGRDGVITDDNGLYYMRARYYSPDMRRFINADIVSGSISSAITLNRFAYANGNPVSNVDPFGLAVEERGNINEIAKSNNISYDHARIVYFSQQWKNHSEVQWSTWDIIKWKTFWGNEYLFDKKSAYVNNYKDVINDAAEKYNIPSFLLAGIMYTEFGGDPMWIDDVAYYVRAFDWSGPNWVDENLTITNNPNLTSFGNTSI